MNIITKKNRGGPFACRKSQPPQYSPHSTAYGYYNIKGRKRLVQKNEGVFGIQVRLYDTQLKTEIGCLTDS